MSKTYHAKMILISLVVIVLVAVMYWNVFVDLCSIWSKKEEYSHGFMIPAVSLYFLWQKKGLILSEKSSSSWLGYVFVFFAMASYFVGTLGDVYFLLRFSFIFLLIGLALLIVGYKATKIMLVPILLLIFSFPLPPVFESSLTAKLQLWSSHLGVSVIRACDIPVYLEGNVIDLGTYKLQVVEACSGLRYLFPLMSLAFICAYMYQVVFWKRALLFLTSIPITVLMNSFRIGVVGILVQYFGISVAEGFVHDFEGWIVFMLCFGVLFAEMWFLSWHERKTKSWADVFGLTTVHSRSNAHRTSISLIPFYPVVVLMVLAIFFIKPLGARDDFFPQRKNFSLFPSELDEWYGVRSSLDFKTIDFLGLSDYALIDFHDKNNQMVNFYIAYYQTQKHGVVPHSPKLCIPGGGWQITNLDDAQYNGIRFNRVVIDKGNSRQLVYYWYKIGNKNISNEYLLKWVTFMSSLNLRRTDVALIRLTTALAPNENIEVADRRLEHLLLRINGQLSQYVPD